VEPRPGGRARPARDVLRQHRNARGEHLAARGVRRAGSPIGRAAGRPDRATDRSDGDGGHRRGRGRAAAARRPRRRGAGHHAAAHRRHRRHGPRSAEPRHARVHPARRRPRRRGPHRLPLADGVGRVQALHARRLLGRVPNRCAVPHRVRHRRRPTGHLQRLRLLRVRLPLRGDRPEPAGRQGAQVHAVLRPSARRARTRLREGLPHPIHPVRGGRRAARTREPAGRGAARRRRRGSPALRRQPGRRRRRDRGVLPAARRARGLRPASGPGGADPRRGGHVACGRAAAAAFLAAGLASFLRRRR
jgi:hypothetical protein